MIWGAYEDAMPERWLIWHGRGLYGSARYACTEHRGDLVAFLREHYGTIGWHPWKRPPYPSTCATPTRSRDRRRRPLGDAEVGLRPPGQVDRLRYSSRAPTSGSSKASLLCASSVPSSG